MKESATQFCGAAPESRSLEEDTQKHQETADGAEKSDASSPFGVFCIFGKNTENGKSNRWSAVIAILILILLVQTFLIVHYGAKKSGFHVDEVFTFNSSMTMPRSWYRKKLFLDKWHDGDVYYKNTRVQSNKRFNYVIPYVNQVTDAHPPLYYVAVHTLCSIFHDVPWKWPALFVNLFFSLLSTVFLYFLAAEISTSDSFALFAAAFWAWSSGNLSNAVYFRMYMMLTTWTILLALLHVRFLKLVDNDVPIEKSTWNGLFWATVAGILTHYYFLVFCFFLCGYTFFYLLWQKKRDLLRRYTKKEFWALAVSFFIFPAMVVHVFAGGRGKEAFKNLSKAKSWWLHFKDVAEIIYRQLFDGPILLSIILLVVIFLVVGFLLRRKKAQMCGSNAAVLFLFLVAVSFVVILSRIAPYQTDRYYFCIYPFFVLSLLYPLCKTGSRILSKKLLAVVFIAVLALELRGSIDGKYVNYIYEWGAKRQEILSAYTKYPAVLVPFKDKTLWMGVHLHEYENYPAVYGCNSLKGLVKIKDNGGEKYLKDGFLVYATIENEENFNDEKFIQDVSEYLPITEWERIKGTGGCPVYFCRTEAN